MEARLPPNGDDQGNDTRRQRHKNHLGPSLFSPNPTNAQTLVVFLTLDYYPPYAYREAGRAAGTDIDIDIVHEMANRAGLIIKFEFYHGNGCAITSSTAKRTAPSPP